MSVILCTHH